MNKADKEFLARCKKFHIRSLNMYEDDIKQCDRLIQAGRGKWIEEWRGHRRRLAVLWDGETEFMRGC